MPKRMTSDEFFAKYRELYGDKHLSACTEFTNYTSYITLYCDRHGDFRRTPKYLLFNGGRPESCPKCVTKRRLTIDEWVDAANTVHANAYDYKLLSAYTGTRQHIDIICPIHGVFTKRADHHLAGQGCKQCSDSSRQGGFSKETITEEQKSIPTEIYLVEIEMPTGSKFDKIGITTRSAEERLCLITRNGGSVRVKSRERDIPLIVALELEEELLDAVAELRYKIHDLKTIQYVGGWTECFPSGVLDSLWDSRIRNICHPNHHQSYPS